MPNNADNSDAGCECRISDMDPGYRVPMPMPIPMPAMPGLITTANGDGRDGGWRWRMAMADGS
jgi:hypothetical protein